MLTTIYPSTGGKFRHGGIPRAFFKKYVIFYVVDHSFHGGVLFILMKILMFVMIGLTSSHLGNGEKMIFK